MSSISEHRTGIPMDCMVVKTANSIYTFGWADENGARTVLKNGKPLLAKRGEKTFTIEKCIIVFLCEGKSARFHSFGSEMEGEWKTSPVKEITLGE